MAFAAPADNVAKGRAIAFSTAQGNCLACHKIPGGELPGEIGPDLAGLKTRYPNRADIVAILQDETRRNPLTAMPPFGRDRLLTQQEIQDVVDFLETL
ncbi:MAG: sulfur oxidation c-type cytochrome SoxX [Hyphomicrobiales bacterium]|nr:sulfur oxidation c-type cytochrome SoxX [Hyphomicrobiales bacterium]MDE2017869.1 sulfur oxidation c-type cytochrome SoxX [Hyphomicrobiales bacterium]